MGTTSFKQLDVWQKARWVTIAIYRITGYFPRHQMFSLTYQMQKAALSIGSNIAEGFGRRTAKDKAHFYTISKGSADELEHYLCIAEDLGFFKGDPELTKTLEDVARMLRRLTQRTLEVF